MVNQGRPEPEILRIIAASPVEFDLDQEMTQELRRAGVSERILAAMRQRQAEAGARSSPEPPVAASPVPRGSLQLTFAALEDSGKNQPPSFEVVREVPVWAMRQLGMEEKAKV